MNEGMNTEYLPRTVEEGMEDEWRKECEGLYDERTMNEGWCTYQMKEWILT